MAEPDTIHIVDDDEAVRDSLRMLLEACNFTVCTYDGVESFFVAAATATGCVVTDISMAEINGLELQRRLYEQGSELPVIVMTGQGDIDIAVRAMRAGAVDFLEKPFSGEALRTAVGRALRENAVLRDARERSARAVAQLAVLTSRERTVAELLVSGLSNKAIGRELGASPRTIEAHRAHIGKKLGIQSLPELVRLLQAAEPRMTGRRSRQAGGGPADEETSIRPDAAS